MLALYIKQLKLTTEVLQKIALNAEPGVRLGCLTGREFQRRADYSDRDSGG
jgi:hypothetical protein